MQLRSMVLVVVFLVVVFAVAVGCGGDDGAAPGGPADDDGASVEGRQFVLRSASGFTTVDGTSISLRFEDGTIGADAGCNSMSGAFSVDVGTLVVGEGLSTTEIGCDPQRHAQDEALGEFLTSSPTLVIDGETLVLETASTRLEFIDREVADPPRPLVNTTWELDGLIDGETVSSIPAGAETTLHFTLQGNASVRIEGACNSGSLPLDTGPGPDLPIKGELALGPVERTAEECGEPSAAVEKHVFGVLSEGTVVYEIETDRLTIIRGDQGLMFRGAD